MKAQGAGKIINIASAYGLVAPSKGLLVSYTASKHAVIGLTKVNAVELAPFGIRVNAIAPGYYFTEINAELRGSRFSLDEIRAMFTPDGEPNIDRGMLSAKADELDRRVKRLKAMSDGLRHAAACPAPSHAACPSFQRLLKAASSGALENRPGQRALRRGA
jgi:NAD(P)-dependent dehydrogenase (short-subunit alcohol dehydrogenase family)